MRASRFESLAFAITLSAAAARADGSSAGQLKAAEAQLSALEPNEIASGISALAAIGGEGASKALSDRLQRGLPPALVEPAIDALAKLARPSSGPILIELSHHHRASI